MVPVSERHTSHNYSLVMSSDDAQIDWAKAAAAWASQRRDGPVPSAPSNNRQPPSQMPFVMPSNFPNMPLGHGMRPGLGPFPMLMNPHLAMRSTHMSPNNSTVAGLPGMGHNFFSGATAGAPPMMFPIPHYSDPNLAVRTPFGISSQAVLAPPIRPAIPPLSANFERESSRPNGNQHGTPVLPQWLKDAAKTAEEEGKKEQSENVITNGQKGSILDDETVQGGTALLTPTEIPLESFDGEDGVFKDKQLSAVKQRVTEVLLKSTNLLLDEIAQEVLQEAKVFSLTSPCLVQPAHIISAAAAAFPQQNHHSIGVPVIISQASQSPSLHLQLSLSARRSYAQPVPDPTQEVEEEEIDDRDIFDNGGLPFINPEEPTKGLFRPPQDTYMLSEYIGNKDFNTSTAGETCTQPDGDESTVTPDLQEKSIEPYVKIVTYSKDGQILGEISLNGRQFITLGSSPKQAHILDNHTSVYSQHCALAVCTKPRSSATKSGAIPCALLLFPLGGSTKIVPMEEVPFLNPPPPPVPVMEETAVDGETPPAPPPKPSNIEIVTDADRKREISIETKTFLQLGSSHRYYLVDTTQWNKSFVIIDPILTSTGVRFLSSSSLAREAAQISSRQTRKQSSHSHKSSSPVRSRRHKKSVSRSTSLTYHPNEKDSRSTANISHSRYQERSRVNHRHRSASRSIGDERRRHRDRRSRDLSSRKRRKSSSDDEYNSDRHYRRRKRS